MHGIVYAKAAEFFQSANLELLFGFPPVAFLISNQFQCVISQMKEEKNSGQIYDILFLSYDRINLLYSYFFCTLYFYTL